MQIKTRYSEEEYDIAHEYAKAMDKELGDFIQSVVLFGSAARNTHEKIYSYDIDVLILINDQARILNKEVVEAYRIITHNTAARISKRLHINTMKLSNFWEYMMNGDPVLVNILRDGVPLIDRGVFEPAKELFHRGRVFPTEENVWVYYLRAPQTVGAAKFHVLQACQDLYWVIINSAHSALISIGLNPVHPEQLNEMINQFLVKKYKFPNKFGKTFDKFHKLSKGITNRTIKEISGKEFDTYHAEATAFYDEVKKFLIAHKQKAR